MDMKIANSWWMYLLGAIVTIFVLAGSIFFFVRAYKDGIKKGMDKKKILQVVSSSAIFTILPSISILIGIIALSGKIGIPLPWIRLSVIGALHYEGSAVATTTKEFELIGITTITNEVFVTIAFVMTLGILVGPLFCLFGFKLYDKKVLSKAKGVNNIDENENTSKPEVINADEPVKKKRGLGDILFSAAFIAMVCAFLANEFSTLARGKKDADGNITKEPMNAIILIGVIVLTFGSMALFDFIEKKFKQKWLANFSLGFSMIIGMASAVVLGMVI